jgi:ATP-dependent RNA helicase RhlE
LLSHVVNFDVPGLPEDYIHRVGRTARAGATGEALTFAAHDERDELRAIERRIGKPIPRRRLEGFDYEAKPAERLEIPVAERLAAHRARKAADRARSQARSQRSAPAPAPRRDGRAPAFRRAATGAAESAHAHSAPPARRRLR